MLVQEVINNRYKIDKILGSGGMSNVYRAYDILLKRQVVLKILKKELTENYITDFKKEVNHILNLNHDNIIKVYDFDTFNSQTYMVYEYFEGETLKEYIKDRQKLDSKEAIDIAIKIAKALDHAHQNNTIHRDIKPQNILINNKGDIKLMDFGIATQIDNLPNENKKIVGSVQYISPEQIKLEKLDSRTDIYSLGILIYEMITGNLPFDGKNHKEIALKQRDMPIPAIDINKYNIPQSLENLILRATAKNRDFRHLNIRYLIADLSSIFDEDRKNETRLEFINSGIGSKEDIKQDIEKTKAIDLNNITKNLQTLTSKNSVSKKSIFIILGALIIGGMIGLFYYLNSLNQILVPEIKNTSFEVAKERLINKGFAKENIIKKEEFSNTVAKDKTIKSNPESNTRVNKNSKIAIIVSKGKKPKEIFIENYIGRNINGVKYELQNKNLIVTVVYVKSDKPVNQIISQSVSSQTTLIEGESIHFEVSKGNNVELNINKGTIYNEVLSILKSKNLKLANKGKTCYVSAKNINKEFSPGQSITIDWNKSLCQDENQDEISNQNTNNEDSNREDINTSQDEQN